MTEFEGCVAVVTGAAAGIGWATASLLASRGAKVVALDRHRTEETSGMRAVVADIRDDAAVALAFAEIGEIEGRVDILVNNAGVSFVGTVEDGTVEAWHRVLDINVLGLVRCTRAALPYMRKSPCAAIVNLSSCTAISGFPQRVLYSASKGAIHAMTFAMAADLLKEHIRVNGVSPGSVDTPFMDELAAIAPDPAAKRAEFHARQPMGRMVDPKEVALAVAYLASPLAASTIGSMVIVDGGMATLRLPR